MTLFTKNIKVSESNTQMDIGLLSLEEEDEEVPRVSRLFDYCLAAVAHNASHYHGDQLVTNLPEDLKLQLYSYMDGEHSSLGSQ